MKTEHLHILQHSLGVNKYSNGIRYRNRFVTDANSTDGKLCQELVSMGLMKDHGVQPMCSGMNLYSVTEAGDKEMKKQSPVEPKLSRSAKRYRAWLNSPFGISFGEYLKLKLKPQNEHQH